MQWVQAAPFRAHLEAVAFESKIPWPALALAAGVSTELARHLLFGRNGRPISKITSQCGIRLLGLNTATAKGLRNSYVPSQPTQNRVKQLLSQEASIPQLAAWCELPLAEFTAMLEAPRCSRYLELMIKAACLLRPQLVGVTRRAA
jgi:hypothetical protein